MVANHNATDLILNAEEIEMIPSIFSGTYSMDWSKLDYTESSKDYIIITLNIRRNSYDFLHRRVLEVRMLNYTFINFYIVTFTV